MYTAFCPMHAGTNSGIETDGFALVYLQRESVKVHFVFGKMSIYYVVENKMHLFLSADQVDAILFFPRQIGVSVNMFEQAPTGCASILLEGANGAGAMAEVVFSIATVSVARIQYVWDAWMASKLYSSQSR